MFYALALFNVFVAAMAQMLLKKNPPTRTTTRLSRNT